MPLPSTANPSPAAQSGSQTRYRAPCSSRCHRRPNANPSTARYSRRHVPSSQFSFPNDRHRSRSLTHTQTEHALPPSAAAPLWPASSGRLQRRCARLKASPACASFRRRVECVSVTPAVAVRLDCRRFFCRVCVGLKERLGVAKGERGVGYPRLGLQPV